MDFDFSDDQEQLRDAVRKWVDKGYDFERRKKIVAAGGCDRAAYDELADLGRGREVVELDLAPDSRLLLLGGEPFAEQIVMWWNFIGRSHEHIVQLRQEWNDAPDDRFGRVAGYRGATPRLEAPPLPADLRLKRRFRRGRE